MNNEDDVSIGDGRAVLDASAWRERWIAGVLAGLDEADRGRFASDDELAAVLNKYRPT